MNIKTFAELKRALTVGTKIKLVDSSLPNNKRLGVVRAVIKQQTNAVKLEGGSWLGLGSTGEKASDFSFFEGGFLHSWDKGTGFQGFNRYQFCDEGVNKS
jgi:hypothetical protein